MSRTGVIIANTGSPSEPTPEAVRTYLREFLTDPRIRPMNPLVWNVILNAFILPKRAVASANKYAAIWEDGGSPLDVRMRSLARRLDAACGEDVDVRAASCYGSHTMQEALIELRENDCDRVVVIPLYPQSAFSTTGVVHDRLHAALLDMDWSPELVFIDRYFDNEAYVEAIANSIVSAGFENGDKLLMTFHSIPMRDIEAGDSYDVQTHATAHAIASKLQLASGQWGSGFQCRFDKSRAWLGPSTSEVIDGLLGGTGRLFVVAPNFSIDCLETFHNIDTVLREQVEDGGRIDSFHYVGCLNDSGAHVELLRSIIER